MDKVQEVIDVLDGVKEKFLYHSRKYARDTRFMSMTDFNHPSYVALVDIGEAILPLLLKDLASYKFGPGRIGDFDPWTHFTLLRLITKESPVREQDKGKLKPIQDAWVKWGKERGII